MGVVVTSEIDASLKSEADLRAKAFSRSCVCPGAGFALLGKPRASMLSFLTSLGVFAALILLCLAPGSVSGGIILIAILAATIISIAELYAAKKGELTSGERPFLARFYVPAVALQVTFAIAVIALFVSSFGALIMAGNGMSPTLDNGERLIYHKRVNLDALGHGEVMAYKLSANSRLKTQGFTVVVGRILAVPGDELAIQGQRYLVNGQVQSIIASLGKYMPVIDVPNAPRHIIVPPDCYFMVQDHSKGSLDSRVLSWALAKNIVGAKLWLLSSRGFFTPVK
jgi:signal peptidase I